MAQEYLVQEARTLAASRYTMHRLGDKDDLEYRERIEESIDNLGVFLEDNQPDPELESEMDQAQRAYQELLRRRAEAVDD